MTNSDGVAARAVPFADVETAKAQLSAGDLAAVLVASAGLGAACSGLATKLATDDLMLGEWPGMALWLAVAALVVLAARRLREAARE